MPCFLDLITPQIHDVGDQETRDWIGPQRILYDHELLFVREGECSTHFPEETIHSPANSFIIKPCGLTHSANQTSQGRIHFSWIHFDWSYQEPTLTEQSFLPCYAPRKPKPELFRPAPDFIPRDILHGTVSSPSTVFHLFTCLNERWNFGTAKERATCRLLLMEILVELLGERFDYFDRPAPSGGVGQLAKRIREMLNRMLDDPLAARQPLESVLGKLGYTYPHLCRHFKRSFGISPITYYNNLRMERACQLLRDTVQPINEVALQIGIANAAYFTRLFVRYTRKTPREYRMSNP